MFKADCHTHTTFSPDGHQTPEEYLKAAQKAGLDLVTVTDHCECNNGGAMPPSVGQWPDLDIKAYTEKFLKIKKPPTVDVRIGVELGQVTQAREFALNAYKSFDWDFILGSLHNIKNEYDFFYLEYTKLDVHKLLKQYLEELYELAECANEFGINCLSHLLYPIKYIYRDGRELDLSEFDAEIHDVLQCAVKNGIGIEINTSSIAREYGDFIPCLKYAKMYHDIGGEIITVGSDAHYASRLGNYVTDAYKMLLEAGFKQITTFKKRQPEFHDIEI